MHQLRYRHRGGSIEPVNSSYASATKNTTSTWSIHHTTLRLLADIIGQESHRRITKVGWGRREVGKAEQSRAKQSRAEGRKEKNRKTQKNNTTSLHPIPAVAALGNRFANRVAESPPSCGTADRPWPSICNFQLAHCLLNPTRHSGPV